MGKRVCAVLLVSLTSMGCGAAQLGGGREAQCTVPHAPAPEHYAAAVRRAQADDPAAVQLFTQNCLELNPCACTEAGEAFIEGRLVEVDPERAFSLLTRGCQGGDPWGCHGLARLIFALHPNEIDRAADLFEGACDDDVPAACVELGRLRMSGIAGDPSPSEAVLLYQRACETQSNLACYFLGEAHALGLGTNVDPERAAELLSWACEEASVPPACTAWARTMSSEEPRRAQLLRRACEGGDAEACEATDASLAARLGTADGRLSSENVEVEDVRGSQEITVDGTVGGTIDLSTLGLRPTCIGFVTSGADTVLEVPAGIERLSIEAHAAADTVVAVRAPDGRWHCDDDRAGGNYLAGVELDAPMAGRWSVWGGTLTRGEVAGSIIVRAR